MTNDLQTLRDVLAMLAAQGINSDVSLVAIPLPHDGSDGFYGAYWRRPAAYLDPQVRAAISVFSLVDPHAVERAITALGADLSSGVWDQRTATSPAAQGT